MTETKMVDVVDLSALDHATLQARVEEARSVTGAVPRDPALAAEINAALRAEVKRIQEFALANPDTEFAKANQGLLLGAAKAEAETESWVAGGSVNLTSFVWWAVGGTVMFKPPLAFMFGGKGGPAWAMSSFTSAILGSFVVDPNRIRTEQMRWDERDKVYKGKCKFQLGQLGLGAGAVRISFYSLNGTYWGMLGGIAGGIGGVGITGELDLVWT